MHETKMRYYFSLKRCAALIALTLLVVACMWHPLSAQTVTQGYGADQPLQRGMIVGLQKKDPSKVEPINKDAADRIHGVIVNANDSPVTLSNEGQQVYVATIGRFDTLVSNQNGTIQPGDYVAVSSISGIGMKANNDDQFVLGKAIGGFDGKSNVLSTTALKGTSKQVSIGRITVELGVKGNPVIKVKTPNLPYFLQTASQAIANKPVQSVRVYLGVVVFAITSIIAAVLLYAGIRNSLISIGRNPLSRKSITKSLIQVVLVSFIIFISGLFGVYLLLRL